MRIALLLDRYLPTPLASAQMFSDLATEMSRLGNDVTVVAGDDTLDRNVAISDESNATVVRVRAGRIRHPSRLIRTLNESRLAGLIWKGAAPYFRSHRCDLVVAYAPTIFWSGLIKRLKALNGGRSYLVLRDLFPQWAVDAGLLRRRGPAFWYFRRHELQLYKSADVIGVQSPGNLDYFSSPDMTGRYNLEVLFNWTAVDDMPVACAGLRARLGLQDKVIFVFGGNLGVAQDLDNVLRLAASLRSMPRIAFVLIGEGSEYARIECQIRDSALHNVSLVPAVPHAEFLGMVAECDVGLITLRRDLKTHNFPGKMLTYMRMRKPMLASVNAGNDLRGVLESSAAGFVCQNGDDESFHRFAVQLAQDESLRTRMGLNAHRLLAERFNVTLAARQIIGHCTPSVGVGRRAPSNSTAGAESAA